MIGLEAYNTWQSLLSIKEIPSNNSNKMRFGSGLGATNTQPGKTPTAGAQPYVKISQCWNKNLWAVNQSRF
jgi:hypothetical protein